MYDTSFDWNAFNQNTTNRPATIQFNADGPDNAFVVGENNIRHYFDLTGYYGSIIELGLGIASTNDFHIDINTYHNGDHIKGCN